MTKKARKRASKGGRQSSGEWFGTGRLSQTQRAGKTTTQIFQRLLRIGNGESGLLCNAKKKIQQSRPSIRDLLGLCGA